MSIVAAASWLAAEPAFAASYGELRSAAARKCRAIDPSDYRSGLVFNPDGYRSFYVRSECFQQVAVQFRDGALCDEVRRRYSLFSSSWGISRTRCQKLVAEGIAADQRTLEDIRSHYLAGAIKLRDFRVERNGNGRDFDIVPTFDGGYAHGHRLTFEIVPQVQGVRPIPFYSSSHFLDARSSLRLFVRQDELRRRFAGFELDRPYPVRATLSLDVGFGNQSGYWSEAFIERVFPHGERTQTLTRTFRF